MLAGAKMDSSKKLNPEITAQLRKLAHDLSNSIETVIQAAYLLNQAKLDGQSKKWVRMIENAADDAAHVNRALREVLRSQSSRPQLPLQDKQPPKRRAS
jgi:nitrogen-specific signal transduction histidine kinase